MLFLNSWEIIGGDCCVGSSRPRAEETAVKNQRAQEKRKRAALLDAGCEADDGEHRRGSKHRRPYTAKRKLDLLEVLDHIWNDASITKKIEAFEGHPKVKGAPYTTVLKWAKPTERARIATAAGEKWSAKLMRIDKQPRKLGKYAEMEQQLFLKLQERRRNARKVSPRWLTATARLLLKVLYPDDYSGFSGGMSWRRRFARRFNPPR